MLAVSVMKREPATPLYNIGVMSRLTGLPIHTLRWIEGQGLISPFRTEGNQRLFSEAEVESIREIRGLMEQNVNLPGIRIILQMKEGKPSRRLPAPRKGKRLGGKSARAKGA